VIGLPGSAPGQLELPKGYTAGTAPAAARAMGASWPGLRATLALIEAACIVSAAVMSVRLLLQGRPDGDLTAVAAVMAAPPAVLTLWVWGQYDIEQLASLRSALATFACSTLVGAAVAALAIEIATGAGLEPAIWAATCWLVVGAAVLLNRAAVALWLRWRLAQGHLARRVAVVGPLGPREAAALACDLTGARRQPCRLAVVPVPHRGLAPVRTSESAAILAEQVRALAPDEIVFVAESPFDRRTGPRLLDEALFDRLRRLPWPITLAWGRPAEEGSFGFTTLVEAPLSDTERFIKRACDLLGASALLLVLLPLLAVLALLIKLDSPGPVFFRQQRRGFDNEIFEVLKFRTMRVHMCDPSAARLTSRNDPRVTRVGAFLRRSSLDELPQLLNVIQGTMSLVGPRPHPLQAKAGERLYEEVVTDFSRRYRVKPGITGWAQVNGLRGNTDSEDKLIRRFEYDMEYIRHWSIWLDLKILMRTPLASLFGENAF
jgi:polysaccharide biosynthesis protein PslA